MTRRIPCLCAATAFTLGLAGPAAAAEIAPPGACAEPDPPGLVIRPEAEESDGDPAARASRGGDEGGHIGSSGGQAGASPGSAATPGSGSGPKATAGPPPGGSGPLTATVVGPVRHRFVPTAVGAGLPRVAVTLGPPTNRRTPHPGACGSAGRVCVGRIQPAPPRAPLPRVMSRRPRRRVAVVDPGPGGGCGGPGFPCTGGGGSTQSVPGSRTGKGLTR